jgi:hypothetical protein
MIQTSAGRHRKEASHDYDLSQVGIRRERLGGFPHLILCIVSSVGCPKWPKQIADGW